MQRFIDVHSRPTRIVRNRRDDDRRTLISDDHKQTLVVTHRATCSSCTASIAVDAAYCGMCGTRVRVRSAEGTLVADVYQLERKLAEGRTATIYRARYVPSGALVAVKVLHAELASDPIASERFRREGRCLMRLRDPHTVAVHDHGETADGTLYIAMELLQSEGLDVRIRTRGAMPWRQATEILRGVCSSLSELHGHGAVHRGLEPANIRLCHGDQVKLIDFGLAKLRPSDFDEELTVGGHAVGMLQYQAPEQLAGHATDRRADLYALGLIGVELLCGRSRNPGAPATVLPHDVPRELERVLLRCLATAPDDRYDSAAEIAAELDRILAESVTVEPARPRRVYPHTPAFELAAPWFAPDTAPVPAFTGARGTVPDLEVESEGPPRWRHVNVWVAALTALGIALGSVVTGCV